MLQPFTEPLRQALAQLRALCSHLPGAEEYTMVHHPAFRVGQKPFLVLGLGDHGARPDLPCVSVNLGRDAQGDLLDDARFSRTPYIGQHGWVTVALADLRERELPRLIEESWRRIARKRDLASWDPTYPTKPANPAKPAKPAKPTKPAKPAKPTKPAKPAKPT